MLQVEIIATRGSGQFQVELSAFLRIKGEAVTQVNYFVDMNQEGHLPMFYAIVTYKVF